MIINPLFEKVKRKKKSPTEKQFLRLAHLLFVIYGFITFVVSSGIHEISVQNRMAGDNLFKAAVKFFNAVFQDPFEPLSILITHQAVLENPAAFVVPQVEQLYFILK